MAIINIKDKSVLVGPPDIVYETYIDEEYNESIDVARIARYFNRETKIFNYVIDISATNKERLKKYKKYSGGTWKSTIAIPYLDTDDGMHRVEDFPPMLMVCSFGPPGSSNARYQLEYFGMKYYDLWELASRGGHTIHGDWKIKSELNKEYFPNPIEYVE